MDSGSKVQYGKNVNREAALLLVLDELLGRDVDAMELKAASQHPEFTSSLTVRELAELMNRLRLDRHLCNAQDTSEQRVHVGGDADACSTTARSWEPHSPCSSNDSCARSLPCGRATPSVPALSMLGVLGYGSQQVCCVDEHDE